ncbi:acyl-CoA dehydrogenase family protein [Xanthobacter wiegelii]|uniref:acyl-CoA dehydrogenase family protein n=1 Tax=Xanthobacter wiegelii TaxID=3119913 RepID=UPI003727E2FB
MDDVNAIVAETATRLFRDHIDHALLAAAEGGTFPAALWRAVEEAGLTLAMIPEDAGGVGLDGVAAADLVRLAGYHAAPLPLAETMLAGRLIAGAGIDVPVSPLTFAAAGEGFGPVLQRVEDGWRLKGIAERVPWGRFAGAVAVVADVAGETFLAVAPTEGADVSHGVNLAGEPRDTLAFDLLLPENHVARCAVAPDALKLMGAALRSLALAGALDRVLEMTAGYVGERVQFGRPLSKFQAIQQSMAVLAGQAAAAGGAAHLATDALAGNLSAVNIASAKIRTGEAAGIAAGIAHQLHGAMGFSFEHMLHFYTKRLWAWRDEFGNEAEWSRTLGAEVLRHGADGLWPFLTAA